MPPTADSSKPAGPGSKAPAPPTPPTRTFEEVERFLARGDNAGAVRTAFPLVMNDVQAVYGLGFPPHWTARDVLAHGLRTDMGRLPDLLFQLYSMYEPVRYGLPRDWVSGDVREILRRIYAETGLRSATGSAPEPAWLSRPTFSVTTPRKGTTDSPTEGSSW